MGARPTHRDCHATDLLNPDIFCIYCLLRKEVDQKCCNTLYLGVQSSHIFARSNSDGSSAMPTVLFVCTANRFRSPIAVAAFQKKLRNEGIEGWQVGSAGTWTDPGLPPAPVAVQAARQLGVSLDGHASRLVNAALLSGYDLILVMEMGHKEALESEFPAVQNRVFLLSEVVDGMLYDIPDPALSEESSPQEIANEVCNLVWKGFHNICLQAERLGRARNSTKSA